MAQPPTKQPYVMPKINFVVRLQHWMDSVPGQTFLNYAYSWGAAIVILGALFKLTHLPGGNLMLFLGMGTEVVVFFLSAFDRPFDKNEVGRELAQDYETDDEIAKRLGLSDDDETTDEDDPELVGDEDTTETEGTTSQPAPAATVGGQAIIFAGGMGQPSGQATTSEPAAPAEAAAAINAMTPAGSQPFASEAERLAAIIRVANDELLHRAQAVLSPEMEEATKTYIEKLQTLADTFTKVDEQSARLAKDSEE
ncbi:MAG: gliding motility protein GldL, partial [Alloprevotella sp.]|nr:gliding motility protein GldL [Alloprevotella sp.]